MQCPRCRHENPPESNFCLGSGARLGLTWPSCGQALPAGSRLCNKCGAAIGRRTGQPDRAREHWGTAAAMCPQMDMRPWLAEAGEEAKGLA